MDTILTILFLIYSNNFNFYKNVKLLGNPISYDFIVNKNTKLERNYVPNDLELLSSKYSLEDKYLRKSAKINFERMASDAKKLGYTIIAVSAYRDYYYQEKLYNKYVEEKGFYYADICSARPGHSEHQTGMAVDISDSTYNYDEFENTDEFLWVKENAHKYGFILRYPKAMYHITGFKYEPWHYRYVGIDIATYIYKNNLTLEEYKND